LSARIRVLSGVRWDHWGHGKTFALKIVAPHHSIQRGRRLRKKRALFPRREINVREN
jgi:hypothetical protein